MQLTVQEAARLLGVNDETVFRWIAHKEVPACRLGEEYRLNRAELLEWATARRMPVSGDLFVEGGADRPHLPTLLEALRAGGIVHGIAGRDKPSVLRSVVDRMRLPEEVSPEFLYQVLMAREKMGSTGIGDGIAIPHVRNPIVLQIPDPRVMLCFLETPIDFGAVDRHPVWVLFMLISPTIRVHLHLLSRLGFALQDKDLKEALKGRAAGEALLAHVERVESSLPSGNGKGNPGR